MILTEGNEGNEVEGANRNLRIAGRKRLAKFAGAPKSRGVWSAGAFSTAFSAPAFVAFVTFC
jgi:hypothetical protein